MRDNTCPRLGREIQEYSMMLGFTRTHHISMGLGENHREYDINDLYRMWYPYEHLNYGRK